MPNTFLLHILVKKGICANARLGHRGEVSHGKRFLMKHQVHQVQLRIPLLGFENNIIRVWNFLSLQLNFLDLLF